MNERYCIAPGRIRCWNIGEVELAGNEVHYVDQKRFWGVLSEFDASWRGGRNDGTDPGCGGAHDRPTAGRGNPAIGPKDR
jgi:hypothetical protein